MTIDRAIKLLNEWPLNSTIRERERARKMGEDALREKKERMELDRRLSPLLRKEDAE